VQSNQTINVQISAETNNYVDANGSTWNLIVPAPVTIGTLQLIPVAPLDLVSGTYHLTSGASSVDGGFAYWDGSTAAFYATAQTNDFQRWVWDGSSLKNVGLTAGLGSASGSHLVDSGSTKAGVSATPDVFVVKRVTGGYTIQDSRTGKYLRDNAGTLQFGTPSTVFVIQP
jgi:hypothetical protein